jgi:hypothetical protein
MGDADIALRHIARRRPEDLARAFVPAGQTVEFLGWLDTQITKLERRPDKVLRLRVAGQPRVLDVEFCFRLREDVPDQLFEYLGFLFATLRLEAPGEVVPPIECVAVVLTGRKRRLSATGQRRTGWPERQFSGLRFRIDAVYQRTVAELRARGSVFWLVFAPLARDATLAAMRRIVNEIRDGSAGEERDDLFTAFLAMATIDPWGHNLRKELTMLVEDEEEGRLKRVPFIAGWLVEAREAAIAELLGRLFARRVGRRPTRDEERSMVERSRAVGPSEVEDALLDLERDALLRWLAEPLKGADPRPHRRRVATKLHTR